MSYTDYEENFHFITSHPEVVARHMTGQDEKITRLTTEVNRLRAALERLSCKCLSNCDWEQHGDICPSWVARAALATQPEGDKT